MMIAGRKQVHTPIIFSKQTIKPSSSTPPHLKTYNLLPLDHSAPSVYCPIIFFYPNNHASTTIISHDDQEKARSTLLKNSLSRTLTQYYPFSGRINDGAYIDCNDEGVDFFEARIDSPLSESTHVHDTGYQPLDRFFPMGTGGWARYHNGSSTSSLVMVQLTHFSCGGIAVAMSMSHKLGDGCTLVNFISHWAAMTRLRNSSGGSIPQLPPPPHFLSSARSNVNGRIVVREFAPDRGNNTITKKFVFSNSKIAQLKEEIKMNMNNHNHNPPSKNEIVTSVLYGCAVRASKANSSNNPAKAFLLTQTVNLRRRMADPLPETTVGNVVSSIKVPTLDEKELEISSLVARIKTAKMKLTGVTDSQICELLNQLTKKSNNFVVDEDVVGVFVSTSLCNYPVYEIDFGWGKPARVTSDGCPMKNAFILMDTPAGDGIEALVALEQQDMDIFQKDPQLLGQEIWTQLLASKL